MRIEVDVVVGVWFKGGNKEKESLSHKTRNKSRVFTSERRAQNKDYKAGGPKLTTFREEKKDFRGGG